MDDEGLSADPARVAAFHTGVSAESRACALLMLKGYQILARRYRSGYGEIDIVARRRQVLVFVEVKARAKFDDAAYAVTPRQQQRIADAARIWLASHTDHDNMECRFDVILVAPKRFPRHLEAAFDAS
ncbi:MAG: YraN family protein [Xanthobacteraceae bacterium]|nr:YraN family protein [Xanthobacteraceae bacterium]